MRYSAGFGLSWQSPIGPLKFSYAIPLKKQITDQPQKFQFQIGTGF
jgi:outer membrane protein insertion porin family